MNYKSIFEFIKSHFSKYNKFPTQKDLMSKFSLTATQTKTALRVLESQNNIHREFNKYYITPTTETTETIDENNRSGQISTETINQNDRSDKADWIKNKVKRLRALSRKDWGIILIRIFMIFIAIITTYMSIYYTNKWMSFFLPPFQSALLSIAMIGFSVIAFEVCVTFYFQKKKIVTILFAILWGIVLTFSILSTVAGLYNENAKQKVKNTEKINEKKSYTLSENYYNIGIKQIEKKMELNSEQERVLFDDWKSTTNIKIRSRLSWKLKATKKEGSGYRKEYNKVIKEKQAVMSEALNKGLETYPDFYDWLASLFGVDSETVEFVLSLFPAVFIDIIAPLSLAVGMFLGKKK